TYLKLKNKNDIDIEKTLWQILNSFIESEKNKKPIKEVIGSDYKSFCDSIIKKKKQGIYVLDALQYTTMIIAILIVIDFSLEDVFGIIKGEYFYMGFLFTLGHVIQYATLFGAVCIIFEYLHKHSIKGENAFKKLKPKQWIAISMLCIIGLFAKVYFEAYGIITLPIHFVIVALALIFIGIGYYKNKKY
ncbi:MAG: hypothetical protein LRZ92_00350, partial [Methanosarcinaceae archaeon]|nr:hypothetical protein [Methanosarcinaceae archaeon]